MNLGHKELTMDIIENLLDEQNNGSPKRFKIKHLPIFIDNLKSQKRLLCKYLGCKQLSQGYCKDCSTDQWICSLCQRERKCYLKYHNEL